MEISPDYDPNQFADREDDVQQVVNLVRALAASQLVPRRTVIFRGERGCGKTWLLRHLAEDAHTPAEDAHTPADDSSIPTGKALKLDGVKSWYLSLAAFSSGKSEENVKAIIKALRRQIGKWRGAAPAFSDVDNLSLHEHSALVAHELQDLLPEHVLVLILDHVYESPPELLAVLEDRLLTALARQNRVLIVMAGRGRGYAWKAPELRLGVDEYWLQGLGVAATSQPAPPSLIQEAGVINSKQIQASEEQLRKLPPEKYPLTIGPEQIEDVLRRTHGHPLSNLLLATGKSDGDVVAQMLENVLQPEQEKHRGRQLLELVCVLRFFDEPHISGLLPACQDDNEFTDVACMQPRDIIRSLLKTNLVRYDTELAAYVMDEVIRRPLEGDLEERRRDLWQRLHEAAWAMYCRWMKEYPQAEVRLKKEAGHHAMRLGKPDEAAVDCPEL